MKTLRAFGLMMALSCALPAPAQESGGEAVYRQRLKAFVSNPGNFAYAPMEPLPGAKDWQPLEVSQHPAIAPEAIAEAEAYARAMRSEVLLVWQGGRMVHAWYAPGSGPGTPMVSKSLSKPLAAIAVGRAIALGKIASLDQPISAFLPELAGKQKGRIRVRHLLDMRSGMLHQGFSPDPASPYNRALLATDFGRWIVNDYPMIGEPGTLYSYANAPADLVALVLERATGRRYGEFLTNEVLRPLGAQGGEIWVGKEGGLAHSGCCAKLPAETFLRLAILLLEDGKWQGRRLLPRGYVTQMRTGTEQNPNFGLGLWLGEPYRQRRGFGAPGQPGPQVLHSEPYLDPDMFLFDGNSNQTVHISPANRLIVLRMGPTPADPREWDNSVLPNLLLRGMAKPTSRPGNLPKRP